MVNPIGANAAATHYVPVSTASIAPETIPEPAVKVTPTDKALNIGGFSPSPKQPDDAPEENSIAVDQALEQVNNSMKAWATGMRFEVDSDAKRVVVSIVDSDTGEVLRTVPSDAVIRVAKMIVQLQGTLINTTA